MSDNFNDMMNKINRNLSVTFDEMDRKVKRSVEPIESFHVSVDVKIPEIKINLETAPVKEEPIMPKFGFIYAFIVLSIVSLFFTWNGHNTNEQTTLTDTNTNSIVQY